MIVSLNAQDFLHRSMLIHPDRVAVIDEPVSPQPAVADSTFAVLGARVAALTAAFDQLELAAGGRVAVLSASSARMLEVMYATTTSGRIVVPVNFQRRPDEIDYILQTQQHRLLLDPELTDTVHGIGAGV